MQLHSSASGFGRLALPRAFVLVLLWVSAGAEPARATALAQEGAAAQSPTSAQPTSSADPAAATGSQDPAAEEPPEAEAPVGQPATLPDRDELEAAIATVESDTTLAEEQRAALLENLRTSLERLDRIAEQRTQIEQLAQQAQQAPQRIEQLRSEIEQPAADPLPSFTATTDYDTLRALKQETDTQLEALNKRLQALQETIRSRRDEAKQLPQKIADLQAEIDRLRASDPQPPEDASPAQLLALRAERATELAAAETALALSQQKQRTYELETPLLKLREEQLLRQQSLLEPRLSRLNRLVSSQRRTQLEEKLAELRSLIERVEPQTELSAERVPALLEEWNPLITERQQFEAQLLKTRETNRKLQADLASSESLVTTDLETGGGLSRSVGLLLQRKRSQLPRRRDLRELQGQVATAVERAQDILTRIETLLDELPAGVPPGEEEAARLITLERSLLQEMEGDAERLLIETLIPLSVELGQLMDTSGRFADLIAENLLWVRSQKPLHEHDWGAYVFGVTWFLQPSHWRAIGLAILETPPRRPQSTVLWGIVVIALIVLRFRCQRRLRELEQRTGSRRVLSMRPVIDGVVATAVLSLPLALVLWFSGRLLLLSSAGESFVQAFAAALTDLGLLLLPLEFCRLAVRKGGFAVTQFQWPAAITQPLTRSMWWTEFTVLPLFFFWRIFDGQTEVTPQLAASAQLLFIAMTAIASLVLWRLIHPRSGLAAIALAEHPGGWLQNLRWLWHPLIAAIPLALGVLAAFGYSYSAAVLALRLYRTIWLLIVAGVLLGFLLKWLSVSRGRLLLKQLRERSAPQSDPQATGVEGEGVEIVDETQPDLSAINDQTRRLIIATLVFFVLFGVYLTWSPVLPALQFLQRFTLWPIEDASGEISYITLANVLAALPLVVVTVVLFRNLPGLLETTLLQRLPLENAVRYAITTLVSYAIAGVGIVATALTLGLRWDSIQWLVAGLGVGLGFGLQEIFANFISGIILLFEQPIRVGDIVTVDSTTGVVSRIRMRATTITNWDRQEYVVPNRDFITGRLTNWTLTDSTNRVVINVGVAYGSDTARACQILQELCAQNNHVLEEPAPLITFEGFGDSTLNLVLRFYLPTLDNRLGVIHQMHTAIHDRFNAEGIEIAFPQRDLHVRSLPPELPMPSQAERATAGERSD